MSKPTQDHPVFKAKVTLKALKGEDAAPGWRSVGGMVKKKPDAVLDARRIALFALNCLCLTASDNLICDR